jgi:hypothetical protein
MASRFWVGGTGTWDASDTTHWATSSNGAGGASVPGSSDSVTFDANSGGGTVTLGAAYNPAIENLTMGAFTGTLDFSVNNNNISVNGTTGFSISGSGVRTLNMGNGTWTIIGTQGSWLCGTTTNLTFNAGSSTIQWSSSNATGTRSFDSGGLTYNTVTIPALSASTYNVAHTILGGPTIATLNVNGPSLVTVGANTTITTLNLLGGSSSKTSFQSNSMTSRTITCTTVNASNSSFRYITFSGGDFVATNSWNQGNTSGINIISSTTRLSPGLG